jgi:dTDP-glucose pyrophosphorylase
VQGAFLLCLGDIFYLAPRMAQMVERFRRGDVHAVLAVKEEQDAASVRRNFTVEIGADGYVTRVVEKPRNPRNLLKGCGIYLFGPEVFDAIRRTPRTALRDEYEITTTIQLMIEDGLKVAAEPVVDWDLNVTFPKDLLEGNLTWLDHVGGSNLIDPGAEVHADAQLERCVVGRGARITAPRSLRECVVVPETVVNAGEALARSIISGDLVIRC